MKDSAHGINSVADQRYYHFVTVKCNGLTLPAYWRKVDQIGRVERPRVEVAVSSDHFTVEHRKLRYEVSFARGLTAEQLSDRGKGQPPFHYDLFAARMDFGREKYLLLGYPFALLALDVVSRLEGDGFFKNGEFQNVDLPKWLNSDNRPFRPFEGLSSSVVSVQFVVVDDAALTAVKLGGHDPFGSTIYRSFIQKRFEDGKLLPDQCVLACDLKKELNADASHMSVGKVLHSRLHIDKPGNFKFYVHAGCANVTLLPYVIGQINQAACLKNSLINPLKRIDKNESE